MTDDVEKETTASQAGEAPAREGEAPAEPPRDLEAELAQAQARADEYLDSWRRAAADLANYRKRTEREREELYRIANEELVKVILPVLDDLDRAWATLPKDMRRFTWIAGVAQVDSKLRYTMEMAGLKPMEVEGKPFDPARHEAVLREETTAYPDGQVMAELQRGYEFHGRVLRPALVKVAVALAGGTAGTGGTEGTESIHSGG